MTSVFEENYATASYSLSGTLAKDEDFSISASRDQISTQAGDWCRYVELVSPARERRNNHDALGYYVLSRVTRIIVIVLTCSRKVGSCCESVLSFSSFSDIGENWIEGTTCEPPNSNTSFENSVTDPMTHSYTVNLSALQPRISLARVGMVYYSASPISSSSSSFFAWVSASSSKSFGTGWWRLFVSVLLIQLISNSNSLSFVDSPWVK